MQVRKKVKHKNNGRSQHEGVDITKRFLFYPFKLDRPEIVSEEKILFDYIAIEIEIVVCVMSSWKEGFHSFFITSSLASVLYPYCETKKGKKN